MPARTEVNRRVVLQLQRRLELVDRGGRVSARGCELTQPDVAHVEREILDERLFERGSGGRGVGAQQVHFGERVFTERLRAEEANKLRGVRAPRCRSGTACIR